MQTGAAVLIFAAALCAWSPLDAFAEQGWGYSIAHDLMSPFCPGRTLAACPSAQADELRLWILTQEAAGATREEVTAQLVERYGESVLGAPPARGWGASAYAVPIGGTVLGIGVVAFALRRLVRREPPQSQVASAAPAAAPASDPELERLVDLEIEA